MLDICVNHLRFLCLRPDRTPHPGLKEFKKVGQPFATEILSATGFLLNDESAMCRVDLGIHFHNRYDHIKNLLDVLKFDWVAEANGKTVCEGYDLGADVYRDIEGDEAEGMRMKWPDVLISFHLTPMSTCSDLVVRITACLRHNLNWAPCSYPVGFEELLLTPQTIPEAYHGVSCYSITSPLWLPQQQANVFEIEINDNELLVLSAGSIEASFNRSNGSLASFRLSGYELLHTTAADGGDGLLSPLLSVQLLRAPTDNDRGGYITQWNAVGLSLSNPLQPVGKPSLTWHTCDDGTSAVLTVHHNFEPTCEDTERIRILKTMSTLNPISTTMSDKNSSPEVENALDLPPSPIILKDLSSSELIFVFSLISSWRLGFHLESSNSIKVWVKDRILNSTIEQFGDADMATIEALFDSLKLPSSDNGNGCSVSDEKKSPVRKGHSPISTRVEIETEYLLNAKTGVLRIKCNVSTPTWWPPLPRVGLRLLLAEGYETVEWFGKGPDECYPDRCSAAYTGLFFLEFLCNV